MKKPKLLWLYLFILAEGLICLILKSFTSNDFISILVIACTSIVFFYIVFKQVDSKIIRTILVISYVLRMAILVLDVYGRNIFTIPFSTADANAYNKFATSIALGTHNFNEYARGLYSYFVGGLYYLFGINRTIPQFINLIMGMSASLMFVKTAGLLKIEGKRLYFGTAFVSLFPGLLIFSVVLLRESIIVFLFMVSIYFLVKWYTAQRRMDIIISVIFLLLTTLFHSAMIVIIIPYVLLYVLYDKEKRSLVLNKQKKVLLVIAILVATVLLAIFSDFLLSRFEIIFKGRWDILFFKINNPKGESHYLNNIEFSNLFHFLVYIFPKSFYFLFSPMPWDWRGLTDALAFVFDSLLYLYIIISIFINIKYIKKENRALISTLILCLLIFIVLFGLGTFTSGTAIRHRAKLVYILGLVNLISASGRRFYKKGDKSVLSE